MMKSGSEVLRIVEGKAVTSDNSFWDIPHV